MREKIRMKGKETFVVQINSQEKGTWQGQVTWLDESKSMGFRSMLELIRLMDSALNQGKTDK